MSRDPSPLSTQTSTPSSHAADRQAYNRLLLTRAEELFANPPGHGITLLLDPDEIAEVERGKAAELVARGLPSAWARVGVVYEDQYHYVLRDAVRFPDGTLGTYFRVVNRTPALGVAMLPRWQGKLLLLWQSRHATRRQHYEIPRGMGTNDRSSDDQARIELWDEIQAKPDQLISLGQVFPDTGTLTSPVHLFLAEIASFGEPELREAIERIVPVSVEEFEAMIAREEINDGFSIAAFTRARARRLL